MRSVRRGGYPRALRVHFPFGTIIGLASKWRLGGSKGWYVIFFFFYFASDGYLIIVAIQWADGVIRGLAVPKVVECRVEPKGFIVGGSFVVFSGIIIAIQWPSGDVSR